VLERTPWPTVGATVQSRLVRNGYARLCNAFKNTRDTVKSSSGTKAHLRNLLSEAGVSFGLSDHFYRQTVLSLNGTKGRTGEFLVHAAVLDLLRAEHDRTPIEIAETQRVMRTPTGGRRIDLYFAETRFGVEIKSGYVRSTNEFRQQVLKDSWLIKNRTDLLSEVLWIFLRGATIPARRFMDSEHIAWMDLDVDELRPPVTSLDQSIA